MPKYIEYNENQDIEDAIESVSFYEEEVEWYENGLEQAKKCLEEAKKYLNELISS